MYSNRNKHNIIKYLPTNDNENIWGISISSIGFQSINPKENYPLKGHSSKYTFNPERGRIIDEFVMVYITRGEGVFMSSDCPMQKYPKAMSFSSARNNGTLIILHSKSVGTNIILHSAGLISTICYAKSSIVQIPYFILV